MSHFLPYSFNSLAAAHCFLHLPWCPADCSWYQVFFFVGWSTCLFEGAGSSNPPLKVVPPLFALLFFFEDRNTCPLGGATSTPRQTLLVASPEACSQPPLPRKAPSGATSVLWVLQNPGRSLRPACFLDTQLRMTQTDASKPADIAHRISSAMPQNRENAMCCSGWIGQNSVKSIGSVTTSQNTFLYGIFRWHPGSVECGEIRHLKRSRHGTRHTVDTRKRYANVGNMIRTPPQGHHTSAQGLYNEWTTMKPWGTAQHRTLSKDRRSTTAMLDKYARQSVLGPDYFTLTICSNMAWNQRGSDHFQRFAKAKLVQRTEYVRGDTSSASARSFIPKVNVGVAPYKGAATKPRICCSKS